ncbi:hypothetical protein ZOSMA_139G00240 [Zostera marina]|uniref:CASP-like protein n=1 Tax=Zostera marina TaxID=29655 RepID=A0A0K9PY45_ZOSMR|nr:hypothetical protein ZOSMA_139G00240 [Zostera marina]
MDSNSKDTEMSCHVTTTYPVVLMKKLFKIDLGMRLSVFLSSIIGIILLLTSKQTKEVGKDSNSQLIYLTVKFSDSSSLLYLISVFAVTFVSSMFTIALSVYYYSKISSKNLLLLITSDLLMVVILTNALGAAGQTTYTGLTKDPDFCGNFSKYCQHTLGSLIGTIITIVTLMLLVVLSSYSLVRRCK